MAELENGEASVAFASGMASISSAVLSVCGSGDHIVAPSSMYSTATNLFHYLGEKFNIETTFVDAANAENYDSAAQSNTRLFWTESPSNPIVQITDLSAVAKIGEGRGIITTAILQQASW
jgi:cystathionine beta-lyase/cystathionine gamma-synthase